MTDGTTPTTQDEATASDNYMQIDPTAPEFAPTKEWEDGATYRGVPCDLQQVSPGQLRVLAITGAGEQEGQGEETSEPAGAKEPPEAPAAGGSVNPAVAKLMQDEKY